MSDTVLDLQRHGREPLLDAYAILKSVAKTNPMLKALLKDPINFYAAAAQAAAKTRAAKKAAAGTTPAPAAPAVAPAPAAAAAAKG